MGNACCGGPRPADGESTGVANESPPPPLRLRVGLLAARALTRLARLTANDPYIICSLSTMHDTAGGSFATEVDTSGGGKSASWNTDVIFSAAQLRAERLDAAAAGSGEVVVAVWDRRTWNPPDALIGSCTLPLAELPPPQPPTGDADSAAACWLPISKGGEQTGEVLVKLTIEPETPGMTAAATAPLSVVEGTANANVRMSADDAVAAFDTAGRVMDAAGVTAEQAVTAATPFAAAAAPHVKQAATDRYGSGGGFGRVANDAKLVAGVTAKLAGNPTAQKLVSQSAGCPID